jgi:hypothetical protein
MQGVSIGMVGLARMIETLFIAAFKAGIPVALASYALSWWALRNDYLDSVIDMDELEKQVKLQSKDKKNRKKTDPVHNKWLAFGGGFYGVVAMLTYIVVELGEVREFFLQFESISAFLSGISFGLLIELVIDSFMNFILAIAWPWYWLDDISGPHIWVWFAVAYGGYWAGTRLALRQHVEQKENGEN